MISYTAYAFCGGDIEEIENYGEAVADKSETWHCHHRAEILPCGVFSADELKKYGLYWHRPASELVFMRRADHGALHRKNMTPGEKAKRRVPHTKEHVEKVAAAHRGKPLTEEHRRKLSEAKRGKRHPNWGRHLSEETRLKIKIANSGRPSPLKGKPLSESHRLKISEAKKGNTNVRGTFWWNDGQRSKRARECPGYGWKRGRLKGSGEG